MKKIKILNEAKKNRMATFIRHQKKPMAILGTILVFITFVVKDNKKEALASSISAMHYGESVFLQRTDNHTVKTRLNAISSSDYSIFALLRSHTSPSVSAENPFCDHELPAGVSDLAAELRTIKDLAIAADLEARQLIEIEVSFQSIYRRRKDLEKDAKTEVLLCGKFKGSTERLNQLYDRFEQLIIDTQKLQARVLDIFRGNEADRKKRYKMYEYLSYLLYVVGWGLTFVGTAFGEQTDQSLT